MYNVTKIGFLLGVILLITMYCKSWAFLILFANMDVVAFVFDSVKMLIALFSLRDLLGHFWMGGVPNMPL